MAQNPPRLETRLVPDGTLVAEMGGNWATGFSIPPGLKDVLADLHALRKGKMVPRAESSAVGGTGELTRA